MALNVSQYYPLGEATDIAITNTAIKNRSSAVGDMSLFDEASDHFVVVENITTMDIRNAVVESINTVYGLATSNNINKYSNFSPMVKGVSGTAMTYSDPSTGIMGSFGCYNHSAIRPNIVSDDVSHNGTISVERCNYEPDTKTVSFTLKLGEIDYDELGVSLDKLMMKVVDNTSSGITTEEVNLGSTTTPAVADGIEFDHSFSVPCDFNNTTHSFSASMYFANSSDVKTLDIDAASFDFSIQTTNVYVSLSIEADDDLSWYDSTNGCSYEWEVPSIDSSLSVNSSMNTVIVNSVVVNLYIPEPDDMYGYGYGATDVYYSINGASRVFSKTVTLSGDTPLNIGNIALGETIDCDDSVVIILEPDSCP